MCACGRKRNEVVTSAQASLTAEQRQDAATAALARLEAEAVQEAITYAQSAANATRNANS